MTWTTIASGSPPLGKAVALYYDGVEGGGAAQYLPTIYKLAVDAAGDLGWQEFETGAAVTFTPPVIPTHFLLLDDTP